MFRKGPTVVAMASKEELVKIFDFDAFKQLYVDTLQRCEKDIEK